MSPDRLSQHLVVCGPFRFSRNPLYLALSLIYGVALLANSLWAFDSAPGATGDLTLGVGSDRSPARPRKLP
jgi:protein-S-isoprenylcysteine O-methyltransferase Ste14